MSKNGIFKAEKAYKYFLTEGGDNKDIHNLLCK